MARISVLQQQQIATRAYAPELKTKSATSRDLFPVSGQFRPAVQQTEIATKRYSPDSYEPSSGGALSQIELAGNTYAPPLNTSPAISRTVSGGGIVSAVQKAQIASKKYTPDALQSSGGTLPQTEFVGKKYAPELNTSPATSVTSSVRSMASAMTKPEIASKKYTPDALKSSGGGALSNVKITGKNFATPIFGSQGGAPSVFIMRSPAAGAQPIIHGNVFSMELNAMLHAARLSRTNVFAMRNIIAGKRPMGEGRALENKQFLDILPSGAGQTKVLLMEPMPVENTAMIQQKVFSKSQYTKPLSSKIGQEDLPGGLRRDSIISGQSRPLDDLVRGIVQINNIKVLFDAFA